MRARKHRAQNRSLCEIKINEDSSTKLFLPALLSRKKKVSGGAFFSKCSSVEYAKFIELKRALKGLDSKAQGKQRAALGWGSTKNRTLKGFNKMTRKKLSKSLACKEPQR